MDWINDVLAERRVVVKSLEEDLNDGQVLAMLVRKYLVKAIFSPGNNTINIV